MISRPPQVWESWFCWPRVRGLVRASCSLWQGHNPVRELKLLRDTCGVVVSVLTALGGEFDSCLVHSGKPSISHRLGGIAKRAVGEKNQGAQTASQASDKCYPIYADPVFWWTGMVLVGVTCFIIKILLEKHFRRVCHNSFDANNLW